MQCEFSEQFTGCRADTTEGLVNINRLVFAFDVDAIQQLEYIIILPTPAIFSHDQADPIKFGQPLQARGQIDRVAQHRVGAAKLRTHVADVHHAGIDAYAYGDVWSRPGLSLGVKSLAMIAMMAAANRTAELRVHLKGALKNGCTPEEIREVLLLVALYCGSPAANEAHRAAVEVLKEEKKI